MPKRQNQAFFMINQSVTHVDMRQLEIAVAFAINRMIWDSVTVYI
jgi:hypothetical protein